MFLILAPNILHAWSDFILLRNQGGGLLDTVISSLQLGQWDLGFQATCARQLRWEVAGPWCGIRPLWFQSPWPWPSPLQYRLKGIHHRRDTDTASQSESCLGPTFPRSSGSTVAGDPEVGGCPVMLTCDCKVNGVFCDVWSWCNPLCPNPVCSKEQGPSSSGWVGAALLLGGAFCFSFLGVSRLT